jgi:nitrogen fixation NifU-like protein
MLQDLYKEIVLDHYRRPRHRHEIEDAEIEEHLNNPLCGDEVTVYANLRTRGSKSALPGAAAP